LYARAAGAIPEGMTRTWLITGCSSGFGREVARAALAAGDTVVATARSPEKLAGLAPAGAEDRLDAVALDVTDGAAIAAAVADALARHGRIDVLVNNAGHGAVGAVEETTEAELRSTMETMFFGAATLTRAVLPVMREQGGGVVVQISSMGGQVSLPGFGSYCAAKFALEALSEALAAEVAPFGIRVVIVEPGAFRTGFGGAGMQRSEPLDAYDESVGPTRAAVDAMAANDQPGDPARAAAAILQAVGDPEAPLHLALGADSVDGIRAAHDARRADLAAWEDVSRATAFAA
jgi:NAD(P)-dependent dehydrogenase (short-subunit alcohol dehydrogenase family)